MIKSKNNAAQQEKKKCTGEIKKNPKTFENIISSKDVRQNLQWKK